LNTPEEMACALFLSRESGKKVAAVLRMRENGDTWWRIMETLEVQPASLNRGMLRMLERTDKPVPLPRETFSRPLTDLQFEERVNVQMTARFFRTSPDLVTEARSEGKSFRQIQAVFYRMGRGGHRSMDEPSLVRLEASDDPMPPTPRYGLQRPLKVERVTATTRRQPVRPDIQ
jgi:hypothetical protein